MKCRLITKPNTIKKTFLSHCIFHPNAKVSSVNVVCQFQKLQQVKRVGLYLQSLSQHLPYSHTWHLQFTTCVAHRFFGLQKKTVLLTPHFLLTCGCPRLFPLQRHHVVWNCWHKHLMILGCAMAKGTLEPRALMSWAPAKTCTIELYLPLSPSSPPSHQCRLVWCIRLKNYSFGLVVAVNINKFCLGSSSKLRFDLALVIPGESWLLYGMYWAGSWFSLLQGLCIFVRLRCNQ
jgi:hypothetical protein